MTYRILPMGWITAVLMLGACVQIKAPKEPIQIQLNVKIDQEIRVRLDKEVEDLIADNPDLF